MSMKKDEYEIIIPDRKSAGYAQYRYLLLGGYLVANDDGVTATTTLAGTRIINKLIDEGIIVPVSGNKIILV